jgi:hypothetical protein
MSSKRYNEMNLLYSNRSPEDQEFIKRVCYDIINTQIEGKEDSDEFVGIFVDGRNREINTLEDMACLHSFKCFSKHNYPIFCFVNNKNNFLEEIASQGWTPSLWRINIIEIPQINSLEEYTEFCINKLYFLLPDYVEKVLTLQPDGMLLQAGWEEFINSSECDWLSSHWRHYAQIDWKVDDKWCIFTKKTPIGNGGFSFRKKSAMLELSKAFGSSLQSLREYGRDDNRIPMEDLFYCGIMNTFPCFKMPTLKQCDLFSCDPLTPKIYNSPNKPFGFHFFKNLAEPDWPECSHG